MDNAKKVESGKDEYGADVATWIGLESNPDVLNKYLVNLGVSGHWTITDLYGLDDDTLSFVPQPVKALILLYPLTAEANRKYGEGVTGTVEPDCPKEVFFVKQIIPNACGAIALVHAVANSGDVINLSDGVLKDYLDKCRDSAPDIRGQILEKDVRFAKIHETVAREGQTHVNDNDWQHHFVAFIQIDGIIYELDGRKPGPIKHGKTTGETFLKDAVAVVQEFMKSSPDNVDFNVTVLAKTPDDD